MSNGSLTMDLLTIWEMAEKHLPKPQRALFAGVLIGVARDNDCDMHNLNDIENAMSQVG